MNSIATTPRALKEAGISLETLSAEINTDAMPDGDPNGNCEIVFIPPEETLPGDWNIRQTSEEHIVRLAESIGNQGQLQPCLGVVDEEGKVKIWAGQHRRLAILALNQSLLSAGKSPRSIEVKIFRKGLTAKQVLEIQISENLYRQMSAIEEAEIIYDVCRYYLSEENSEASYVEIAGNIGRSADKVGNAMAFARLDPIVAQWAKDGRMTYTTALQVARIDEEEHGAGAHQRAARWILERQLDGDKLRAYINTFIDGDPYEDALFSVNAGYSEEGAKKLEEEAAAASLRQVWARNTLAAESYFSNMMHLIKAYGPRRVRFSAGVEDLVEDLVVSAARFTHWLREVDPKRYEEFHGHVKKSIGLVPFWMVKPKGSRKKKK